VEIALSSAQVVKATLQFPAPTIRNKDGNGALSGFGSALVGAMMAERTQRDQSYGQERNFRGLEAFAIRQRVGKSRWLLDQLFADNPGRDLSVIELGCGYRATNLQALSTEFENVAFTGVDLSVNTNSASVELIQANLAEWKPNKRYDGVLSLAVAEHLLDPRRHFHLIADCLEKGGLAGLTTPTPQAHLLLAALSRLGVFDRDEIHDHKLYLTQTGIEGMASEAGLRVEGYSQFSLGMNQWTLLRKL
jgi:hypothetical protein